jgi:lipoate-protein ligase A
MEKPISELLLWRDAAIRTPAGHMACDEALLGATPLPILRLYRWDKGAASFGYAQRFAEVQKSTGTLPLARRWTGGGIVYHGADLTIALAVPAGKIPTQPSLLYEKIHGAILAALRQTEPAARLAKREESIAGPACFTAPVAHDILSGGTKLLGGAIRRTRPGTLYQGSLQNASIPEEALAAALAERVSPMGDFSEIEARASKLESEKYSAQSWLELR